MPSTEPLRHPPRYAPLERLALCPHCGFATSASRSGDEAEALQGHKLELVVETARAVWGEK